ncbi:MAG: efflux RND transporter periplasmic adaptor subunit [Eubacterium sp.]|nr:efflux RND transporter periplasmic adaptor subunit [Eubacterium sp.]
MESKESRNVSANVNGVTIKKLNVSVGDEVKKGKSLLTFDKSDLQESLSEAKESLSDAESESAKSIEKAQKQLAEAKEEYEEEKENQADKVAKAKKEYQEAKKANQKEEMAQAKTAYENAVQTQKTTLKQSKSNIEQAQDSVDTAKSNGEKSIKEARKQVTEAQNNIDKCSVTAPIDGIVTSISVQEGDTYSGGTILQIQDISGFTISTTVDEYDISNVKVGQKVIVLTEATGEDELEGEVTFVAPSMGSSTTSTSSQSGNGTTSMSNTTSSGSEGYEVDIKLKSADDRLKLGLTARCSIIEEEASNVFAVPYDAISQNTSGESVINISEGESGNISRKQIIVTQGMESDYYVEVQSDELQEGMNVMIPTDATDSSGSTGEERTKNSMSGLFVGGSEKRMPGGTQGGFSGGGGRP